MCLTCVKKWKCLLLTKKETVEIIAIVLTNFITTNIVFITYAIISILNE